MKMLEGRERGLEVRTSAAAEEEEDFSSLCDCNIRSYAFRLHDHHSYPHDFSISFYLSPPRPCRAMPCRAMISGDSASDEACFSVVEKPDSKHKDNRTAELRKYRTAGLMSRNSAKKKQPTKQRH
ncbi:hypothetical protein AC578_2752 [Pseudocercospora eumusae]|uniref:Uncharacterized protein n=1 Tax=Pseudocercospora eumusae TaxID=321146 RepID=A0A139HH33_9PEZI|nr:hypothetical protein AC578_2752 [Pseudocercospora eumusae]